MTLQHWLSEQRLRAHKTSKEEIRNLLSKVERDLEDAAIVDISTDRRFMIAYDGALTLATILLYCEGYETRGKGQHWLTFKLLPEIMGNEFSDLANYPTNVARSGILVHTIVPARYRWQNWMSCCEKCGNSATDCHYGYTNHTRAISEPEGAPELEMAPPKAPIGHKAVIVEPSQKPPTLNNSRSLSTASLGFLVRT